MARPNDILRFKLVVPKRTKLRAETALGAKINVPVETALDYQRTRDGKVASINIDGYGLAWVNPDHIQPEWITPIDRRALMWAEAKYCGGKYAFQAYTQQNASRPFHAKRMWYDK